ncbi:MAG: dipeptidase PepE [Acidobacteriota bacterium]|nr:dipeptidase PepE [Acidobacteriota bacterium]
MSRLLLISNSTSHGEGYLDHCIGEMLSFLGPIREVCFVPFAVYDRESYGESARRRFAAEGIEVRVLTTDRVGGEVLEETPAVFAGGGNTFRLLKTLQDSGFQGVLRRRTLEGMPYMGASAGSNIAAPTIRTTNDMPIVQPASFDSLDLLPFQINPHYLDPDPVSQHMGETREQRLVEYLEENDRVVVGLREGAWIRVEGDEAGLGGRNGARILRRDTEPEERPPGASLTDLL